MSRRIFVGGTLVSIALLVACERTAPYLVIDSLEHFDTCAAQRQPAKVREGMAERYVINYSAYRVKAPPQFRVEGSLGMIEVPNGGGRILYGTGIGTGRIIATTVDEDGATFNATFDVNVVAQDSYPAYTDTCPIGDSGTRRPTPQDPGSPSVTTDAGADAADASDAAVAAH